MAVEVILPRVDMDMAAGKIVRWHAKAGERVSKGAPLFEIETDKATMEIDSPADGTLGDVRVGEGETSPVGQAVAYIFGAGETVLASAAKAKVTTAPEGVRATPLARRLARQAGVSLAAMTGSGPRGRVVSDDVRKMVVVAPAVAVPAQEELAVTRLPLDPMRRTIAQRLTEAKQTVPHFYLGATCVVDQLVDIRQRLNARAPKAGDGSVAWKLSINDFIIKALALALQRVPAANVTWGGDHILQHHSSDVAVAVAVEGGLFTPVIRGVESKSLSTLSAEMKALVAKAQQRKLQPEDYQGGTATISNLGMYGIEDFTAIINPPHASILAVGAVVESFVPVKGLPVLSHVMRCTLSCDHRAIDGAVGAQLMAAFRRYIEDPALMLA